MIGIGGSTIATIQKLFTKKNEYGEKEQSYISTFFLEQYFS